MGVEVRIVDRKIQVRDSKDPQGPVLNFSVVEWTAFLGGVRDGEFDLSPAQRGGGFAEPLPR